MHPFSLDNTQKQNVTGGNIFVSDLLEENGGPIYVTLAIPEDGNDPLPPLERF
ncbi:hypothetical protein L1285_19180 [Pseudoalteromonas sp. DL2-H2.2]|uniref:hypothetical protein n=1 Tax=Pseudoalteromonas sp. DL2-H2.2 TaxID=2908889 RepID=UPI001F489476|nr:hypothetical protein [Pseudoalteromonas sp. DL2-H2.2]MCF2910437.1 hypothetical protein [Pseudoalteromonas sp. DL2-H2.2]MCF2910438.1 hypothetical protein [Pseudoalteromonas sp. DL2-H2.2]MCF2910439.1 hypothetical protein [Pseudoalteromonas sp. DL2-H2.2]